MLAWAASWSVTLVIACYTYQDVRSSRQEACAPCRRACTRTAASLNILVRAHECLGLRLQLSARLLTTMRPALPEPRNSTALRTHIAYSRLHMLHRSYRVPVPSCPGRRA